MSRFDDLTASAPDIVAAWQGVDEGRLLTARREVRLRAGVGSAGPLATQLGSVAAALASVVEGLPDEAFAMPGGEADWNVAQALGHAADARAGLAMAGSLAASGRWPEGAKRVVPGVPGDAAAGREQLLRRIATSQRIVERAARTIAGHETDPCPLDHPLVGTLSCGEWLLYSGVHDLMHLTQLEELEASLAEAR